MRIVGAARASDPDTSHEAASKHAVDPALMRRMLSCVYTRHSETEGFTHDELAQLYKAKYPDDHRKRETIRRRVTDLAQEGLIARVGKKKWDGSMRATFLVTEQGYTFIKGGW